VTNNESKLQEDVYNKFIEDGSHGTFIHRSWYNTD